MSIIEFDFFSDHYSSEGLCHIIVVTAVVKEGEADLEKATIYDSTAGVYRFYDNFPPEEQIKMDMLAMDYVDEKHYQEG